MKGSTMKEQRPYTFFEAVLAGLLGYATVVVVVAVIDIALGRPLFYTPAALGRVLVADPAPPGTIDAGAVLAYNGMHLLAFLSIGLLVTAVARFVEFHPVFWFIAYFIIVSAFFASEMTFTVIDPEEQALSWWSVLLATAAAAWAMGTFINRRHPRIWQQIEAAKGGK